MKLFMMYVYMFNILVEEANVRRKQNMHIYIKRHETSKVYFSDPWAVPL